jgi:hypothetical protein
MARRKSVTSTGKPTGDVQASPAAQAGAQREAKRGRRKSTNATPGSSTMTTASTRACPPRRGRGRASGCEPGKIPRPANTCWPITHSIADLLFCEWDCLDGPWFHALWGASSSAPGLTALTPRASK